MKRFTLIICSIMLLTGLATGVSAQKDDKKKPPPPIVKPGNPKPPKDDKPKKPAMAEGSFVLYLKD